MAAIVAARSDPWARIRTLERSLHDHAIRCRRRDDLLRAVDVRAVRDAP
jgi:hypothetical protein